MGIFNQLIPKYIKTPDGKVIQQNVPEEVYIDDAFDPLFNKRAQEYLNYKYGNPFLGTLGGFAEGVDNALIGQKDKWGILGPGMGILSGFGRTMDKAGDFIIGGLTEGVNAINKVSPIGADTKPENPLHNIFVEDEDYTGTRLLAAMGNSMSKLAGNAVLDESDFSGAWNVAGTGLELMTDPGILGGSLAKRFAPEVAQMSSKQILKNIGNAPVKHTVGEIGQLLSNYDDLMAKVAWDATVPGLRLTLNNVLDKFLALTGNNTYGMNQDVVLKNYDNVDSAPTSTPTPLLEAPKPVETPAPISPPTKQGLDYKQVTEDIKNVARNTELDNILLFEKMIDDLALKYNLNSSDPELYEKFLKIKDNINRYKGAQTEDLNFESEILIKQLSEENTKLEQFYYNQLNNALYGGVEFDYDGNIVKDNLGNPIIKTPTKAGKKLTIGATKHTPTLEELAFDDDVQTIIRKFDTMDTMDTNIGPGYFFNLDYYKNVDGDIDYLRFLEDLEDNTVKADSGEFLDDKIIGYMKNTLKKPFETSGYSTPDVKIFHSTTYRKNKAIKQAEITNKKFKVFLKKYFGKEHVSVEEFTKRLKESNLMQEYLQRHIGDNPKFSLENRLDNVINTFFNTDIIKKGKGTTVDYFKTVEDFSDFIYKNFHGTVLEGDSFSKDLMNFAEDFNINVLEPLTFTKKKMYHGPGELFSDNTMRDINYLISQSDAFRTETGDIDLDAIIELKKALPNFEIRISNTASKQLFKSGEMDDTLNHLKDFLLEVKSKISSDKYIKYSELNPYNTEYYKSIKNDPIKKGLYTYVLNGAWSGKGPKNISLDDAIKRIDIAKKGTFYGNDLLRFTKAGYIEPEKLTEINSSFLVDGTLYTKRINESFKEVYEHLNNKTLAQEVIAPTTMNENITNNVINKVIGDTSNLDEVTGSIEETVKDFGTPKQRRLFGVFNDAIAVPKKAKGGDYATLRMKPVEGLLEKAVKLKETVDEKRVAEYFRLKDLANDDIITADNFISELTAAGGRVLIPLNRKTQSAKIKEITKTILDNIDATSIKGTPTIALVLESVPNTDYSIIGYKWVQDVNTVKRFNKLKFDKSRLKDIVIHKAEKVDLTGYEDLEELFSEAQGISENLSTTLGFTSFNADYFKHALSDSPEAAEWLATLYKDYDIDDLENLNNIIANLANNNGTFRIQPLSRSLRGNFADWNQFAPIFSTDLEAVMKSTFSKGIFDNVNFQSYVDLFVNDNFKIKHYARTTEDLKEILYAGYDKGLTGNLNNTVLVAPVYNEAGKLVKFKRFDKFSEKGLTEALNNPDTILIPTNILTPLDKILRKDAKMSSKVFQFINKYINIPFKFGTLMNPGFLVGNMGDAYFKQAVTLSSKYGTSLTEELANVSASLKQVQLLNNKFDDIYRTIYLKKTFTPEQLEARPLLMMSDFILKNKKSMQEFKDWFKDAIANNELSKLDENTIRIWLFINEATPATFRASSELGNLPIDKTAYNVPRTPVERILTGDPSNELTSKSLKTNLKNLPKEWKTYGLFANNPLSAEIIKSSSAIEDYFRSACLLNDLKHQYEMSDIAKILHNYDFKEIGYAESMEALNIKMMEATNTMYSANFNYDDMPDLMDGLSTFIPFPTFFMKNLGYWLKIAMERPELIDNLINVQTGLWGDRDLSKDEFQAEAMGRGAIPMSATGIPDAANRIGGQKLSNLFKGIFKPSPMNSMFGAFNLLNNPVEDLAFRTNPVLTPITRHLQDEGSVRYRPYSTNQYERNITPKDKRFNDLELMFHRLNPFERSINTGLRTPGKVVKGEAQLSDFAPSIFQPDF